MYQYNDFDRQFVLGRAAQFRDQLQRHLAGELPDDHFKALRLQNGWYIQRHAPMTRIAVPYGVLSSRQLRKLAEVARRFDLQDAGLPTQRGGYGHFSTRTNCQYNWIPLERAADVMECLAEAQLHGIQTSGNCIRNITTDALAGVAADELVDPRPYCELLRQWSTVHPEFAFLPRKFKIAIIGADEDRAAMLWHDVGLRLVRRDGHVGFEVYVGGGMGRTPILAPLIEPFVPWERIALYLDAAIRIYNEYGRRDNLYKSRIKILVKAEGQKYIDAVRAEYARMLEDVRAGRAFEFTQAELDRIAASFATPAGVLADPRAQQAATPRAEDVADATQRKAYGRWLDRNVGPHRLPGYRSVTLSLKRIGQATGDVTADQMDAAAALADRFSAGEIRVTHQQNLLLPWVPAAELPALWQAARDAGFATPNIGLATDMICCPGGDLCSLANARSIPIAAALMERLKDLDATEALGDIDLHISGCINSCGHHHSGHIGILGVDKDGEEWYQLTLGGADGSTRGGVAKIGKVVGPSFSAAEIVEAVQVTLDVFEDARQPGERFIETFQRLGMEPFRKATDAIRGLHPHRANDPTLPPHRASRAHDLAEQADA